MWDTEVKGFGVRIAANGGRTYLCEDCNGTISTRPTCDLWTDQGSFFLVVPRGKDFGFACDGSALILVTDIQTGPAFDENVRHAREGSVRRPAGYEEEPAPYLSRSRRGTH